MGAFGSPELPVPPAAAPAPPQLAIPGLVSSDGWWRWNGRQWILNVSPPPPPAPRKRTGVRRVRWVTGWALLASILLGICWFVLAIAAAVDAAVVGSPGPSNAPGWLVTPFVALVLITPILAVAWIVLNVACWISRPT